MSEFNNDHSANSNPGEGAGRLIASPCGIPVDGVGRLGPEPVGPPNR